MTLQLIYILKYVNVQYPEDMMKFVEDFTFFPTILKNYKYTENFN